MSAQTAADAEPTDELDFCAVCLTATSWLLVVLTFPFSLCLCVKHIQAQERAVIFRLGQLLPGGPKGPGIVFILPCIDSYRKVDLGLVSFVVPPQEMRTRDAVTVTIGVVVDFRVNNPTLAVTRVQDANDSMRLLAQDTLRDTVSEMTLEQIVDGRQQMANNMQTRMDAATDVWGVKVERLGVNDCRLTPPQVDITQPTADDEAMPDL